MLCCHLVGEADLPGVPLIHISLPSSFLGVIYSLGSPPPPILHLALWEDDTWLNQKCGMSLWVSGPGRLILGGQAKGRGKWLRGVAS